MNAKAYFSRMPSAGFVQSFASRLVLGIGYGLCKVPADDRKKALEKGLQELWFLAAVVVQWWATSQPASAETKQADAELAPFSLKPLASNLQRVRDKLEPFAKAAYEASSEAGLAGAGVFFKDLTDTVSIDTLLTALRMLFLEGAEKKLFTELPPPPGLKEDFERILANCPVPPAKAAPSRAESFERADLGVRPQPKPDVKPPQPAPLPGEQLARTWLATRGWGGADLDRILEGPNGKAGS
mgnify:FL=1